ncbi:MAG: hypothetical protein IJI98_11550 [Methanosphaera sp.]|nr:hypothetical protein [Methanosphaera sp.]
MKNKLMPLILLGIVVILMYVGSTMFYNTGLGITDLNVHKSDSNDTAYDVSYMLRSVRGFNKVSMEYKLFDAKNQVIATGSNELNGIKDGTFQINDTLVSNDSSQVAKKIKITLFEIDESSTRKQIFDQTFDIN